MIPERQRATNLFAWWTRRHRPEAFETRLLPPHATPAVSRVYGFAARAELHSAHPGLTRVG
jgi:hypothetical protein